MYPITLDTIIEVRYLMLYQAQRLMTVLHYVPTPPLSTIPNGPAFVAAAATTFSSVAADSILLAYKNCCVDALEFTNVEVQVIAPTRWAKKTQLTFTFGNLGEDGLPSNSAADITRRTELVRNAAGAGHRGGVGTTHVAGVPLSGIDQNALTAAYRNGPLSTLALALLAVRPSGGATLAPVLWHRNAPAAPFASQIAGAQAEPYVRTMRRRGALLGI